jgi:hypothetical protein
MNDWGSLLFIDSQTPSNNFSLIVFALVELSPI